MNADRLLALYERIADAPDAIVRLCRFILDLAVRGKLVEQDRNDEPASELLKRIAAEKARLVRAGESRKSQPLIPIVPAQQPFAVPTSWEWVSSTYPTYGVSDLGKKIKTKDVLESGAFPVVDQGKVLVRGYCNDPRKVVKVSEPLIVFGDHTRETKLIDFDFVVGADGVKILQPVGIDARFYHLALQWLPLESRGYSRHFKILKSSYIPLPPLAEQHRIVAKVDELIAFCDRLEVARAEREATRDRLTKASLARLSASDIDDKTFRSYARFAVYALPALTARADQVEHLRQTILNLAVRGKLVEQDPNDEPASIFLAGGKRCKSQEFRPADAPGWLVSSVGSLLEFQYGKGMKASERLNEGPVPVFGSNGIVGYCETPLTEAPSIIVGRKGSAGALNLCNGPSWTTDVAYFVEAPNFFDRQYLLIGLQTLDLGSLGKGIKPGLSRSDAYDLPLTVPPLAEQHRIVDKVDELMALCDRLEINLGIADTGRQHLLESLLRDVLVPSNEPCKVRRQ